MSDRPSLSTLENPSEFVARHIGISPDDEQKMLQAIGLPSTNALIDAIVPANIRRKQPMQLPAAISESDALAELKAMAQKNRVLKSFIGQGYYGTHLPAVILRNVLENPAWYTSYTPYQAEISQGRMEALLNFQTLVADLTGMEIANASMLDEATAAAEAMTLARRVSKAKGQSILVLGNVHPQTLEILHTRAAPLGIQVKVLHTQEAWQAALAGDDYFAAIVQYPGTTGAMRDYAADVEAIHAQGALAIFASDLLALALLKSPGEMGADIVIGNSQRFGMPMGAGGPHAAFMACRDSYKRNLPGRLVGVSKDVHGNTALRLALQTREQHIRRDKATSNICTAQALPAIIASMYAVYHGPEGIRRIAQRVALLTATLKAGLDQLGFVSCNNSAFDTLCIRTEQTDAIRARAVQNASNLRRIDAQCLGISLDETHTRDDVQLLWQIFAGHDNELPDFDKLQEQAAGLIPENLHRSSAFMTHPVFNSYHSETAMLRYIRRLSDKDLALDRCMIPLGSCTMKLNASSEMIPVTWPEFAHVHPYAPADQLQGYAQLDEELRGWLSEITGYADVSLQPNAGSQGEYAGLLAIRAWHQAQGQAQRDICLIPASAHGTNPASAVMAGLKVVVTKCDAQGNVDLDDLRAQCEQHAEQLACVMITYPSTHGVFEPEVKQLCEIVHAHGGRVYLDGANLNALVGLAAPGEFGGDVSHLNLHKTFCIPHGGGGPGVGPVCVVEDLLPYLPSAPNQLEQSAAVGPISAARYGNAAVLPITWMYIRMMGAEGLKRATEMAILSANYISQRLAAHYPTLYTSAGGHVGHECILDMSQIKESSGVMAEDIAKRLADYGFHAPTLSFPVSNTLMVEPTESEDLNELERFIAAMIAIREEIRQIEQGQWPQDDNPLKNAPHTASSIMQDNWPHPYPRQIAAALEHNKLAKYWPVVGRIDNVYGDRNLMCSCPPIEAYM